ncbi:copper amine oxidase N-terminal domain-containing protein [Peptococcaceae bacterium 1198_IL3148]
MKKSLMCGLILVFMFLAVSTSGFASAAPVDGVAPPLQVQLNGSIVNVPPYMSVIEGQVMVPLRWSADLLGATSVEWDAATRTVTITTPQDFYSMEKFSAYSRALKSPIEDINDQIRPLPDKVKDMGLPELLPDRHFVLNLEKFRPAREGLTLPAPRPYITITITSPDGTYEHSSVAHSIENYQDHYYLPMDWLGYLFNARVSYNEASNILSIQSPDLEQIKSEIERIENVLIPHSADEAIELWGRGEQTRNGALQYAALSPQLRQEADQSAYVLQSYWVTGGSSPQVGPISIESRKEISDTKVEYTLSFPEISSGQTYAIATEKMVVEKLHHNGREGWFITELFQSSGYGIIEGEFSLMDSKHSDWSILIAAAQAAVKH